MIEQCHHYCGDYPGIDIPKSQSQRRNLDVELSAGLRKGNKAVMACPEALTRRTAKSSEQMREADPIYEY